MIGISISGLDFIFFFILLKQEEEVIMPRSNQHFLMAGIFCSCLVTCGCVWGLVCAMNLFTNPSFSSVDGHMHIEEKVVWQGDTYIPIHDGSGGKIKQFCRHVDMSATFTRCNTNENIPFKTHSCHTCGRVDDCVNAFKKKYANIDRLWVCEYCDSMLRGHMSAQSHPYKYDAYDIWGIIFCGIFGILLLILFVSSMFIWGEWDAFHSDKSSDKYQRRLKYVNEMFRKYDNKIAAYEGFILGTLILLFFVSMTTMIFTCGWTPWNHGIVQHDGQMHIAQTRTWNGTVMLPLADGSDREQEVYCEYYKMSATFEPCTYHKISGNDKIYKTKMCNQCGKETQCVEQFKRDYGQIKRMEFFTDNLNDPCFKNFEPQGKPMAKKYRPNANMFFLWTFIGVCLLVLGYMNFVSLPFYYGWYNAIKEKQTTKSIDLEMSLIVDDEDDYAKKLDDVHGDNTKNDVECPDTDDDNDNNNKCEAPLIFLDEKDE